MRGGTDGTRAAAGNRAVFFAGGFFLAVLAAVLASCGDLGGPMEWGSYSVEYHADNGSGETRVFSHRRGELHVVRDSMFEWRGRSFEGWDAPGDLRLEAGRSVEASGTLKLRASWRTHSFTVVYKSNDAEDKTYEDLRTFLYDEPQSLWHNTFAPLPGVVFYGWATESDGELVYLNGETVKNLADGDGATVFLHARWGVGKYTIYFDANGGEGNPPPTVSRDGETEDLNSSLPNEGELRRPGHVFVGWSFEPDGSGEILPAGKRFVPTKDETTLYAVWRASDSDGDIPDWLVGVWHDEKGRPVFEFTEAGRFRFPKDALGYSVTAADGLLAFSLFGEPIGTANFALSDGKLVLGDSAGEISIDGTYFAIPPGLPEVSGSVGIEGTATVGERLEAKITAEVGGAYSFSWLRVDGGESTAIENATGPFYVVADDDAGSQIAVVARRAGYSGELSSDPTDPVTIPGAAISGTVRIDGADEDGRAKVGQTLTADIDSVTGTGTPVFRWLREGNDIGGATEKTYLLRSDDAETKVSVAVRRRGYEGEIESVDAVYVESARTERVTIAGDPMVGRTLRAVPGDLPSGEANFTWKRNGIGIEGTVPGSPEYSVRVEDAGAGISVTATVDGESFDSGTVTVPGLATPPGGSLVEKLGSLAGAEGDSAFLIAVSGDESLSGIRFPEGKNISVVLRGEGGRRVLKPGSNGSLFGIPSGFTLVLDENVALVGLAGNTDPLVVVGDGGSLVMNGGSGVGGNGLSGGNGGGVRIASGGTFTMNGGEISGNNTGNSGGGVSVEKGGTFTMNGGNLSGNTSGQSGGGVYSEGDFYMYGGGKIYGNKSGNAGGGVWNGGILRIVNGIITGGDARDEKNVSDTGRNHALLNSGSASRGRFANGEYVETDKVSGDDSFTESVTINIANGEPKP